MSVIPLPCESLGECAAPDTETERVLLACWQRLLAMIPAAHLDDVQGLCETLMTAQVQCEAAAFLRGVQRGLQAAQDGALVTLEESLDGRVVVPRVQ